MSKTNDKYLDSVVNLYKDLIFKGEVIPLEFKFPAFQITQGTFNLYAVEFLSERAKISIDTGNYGLQKYHEDIDYDALLDYSIRKKSGLTTPIEDKTIGVVIEKILPEKIKQDTSMTANESRNGALAGSCIKTMDYKLQELINFEYLKNKDKSGDKEIKSEIDAYSSLLETNEKIDFIATLISMKEVLPQIHRKVLESLSQRQSMAEDSNNYYKLNSKIENTKNVEIGIKQNKKITKLINDLRTISANPTPTILKRALEVDSTLTKNFIEKYPLIMKEVFKEVIKTGNVLKM